MKRTPDEMAQFVEGVKQGAEDAGIRDTSDVTRLSGDPHYADGYMKGYTLVSSIAHADD